MARANLKQIPQTDTEALLLGKLINKHQEEAQIHVQCGLAEPSSLAHVNRTAISFLEER